MHSPEETNDYLDLRYFMWDYLVTKGRQNFCYVTDQNPNHPDPTKIEPSKFGVRFFGAVEQETFLENLPAEYLELYKMADLELRMLSI